MDEVAGAVFGPYRLGDLLGRGGMGEVYRAHHTGQDRVVALKLLLPALSGDADFRRRFERESRLVAQLNDPHVIPVHGWGEIDGRLYLDMRFVEGEDLAARLARAGPMPPGRAVAVVTQVAQALDAAHEAGLVHRDVKPSNVLLTTLADGDEFAYLVDFGIARSAGGDGTTGVAPVGTLAYMAPERFLGTTSGRPADVYALACVLHETLTGRRPFEVDEPMAYVGAHLSATPRLPSSQDPRVPSGFDAVVARGLEKDPDRRYPSAGALAAAARAVLQRRAAPVTRTVPPAPTTTPAPGLRAGGSAAAATDVAPRRPGGTPVPPPVAAPPPSQSPRPPRRRLPVVLAVLVVGVAVAAGLVFTRGIGTTPTAAPPTTPPPTTQATTTRPVPTLSAADAALLSALPAGFDARVCATDPDRLPGVTAALRCDRGPSGVAGSARFARFADVMALDGAVAADAQRRQLPLDKGMCRDGADVQSTWMKNGAPAGLVACHGEPGGGRTITWSDRLALALGTVTRSDGDAAALYDWWTTYDFTAP